MVAANEKERLQSTSSDYALSFTKVPLFHAAWLFALGVFLQSVVYLPLGNLIAVLLLLFFVTVLSIRSLPRWSIGAACLLWLCLGYFCASVEPVPAPHREMLGMADGLIHSVEGDVIRISNPRTRNHLSGAGESGSEETVAVDLMVHRVERITDDIDEMVPIRGGLRLTLYANDGDILPLIQCGDLVHVDVRMETPQHYATPGAWDRAAYLREQGIDLLGAAKLERFAVVQHAAHPSLACRIQQWQHVASTRLMKLENTANPRLPVWVHFQQADGAMLAAMVTGDRSFLTQDLRAGFERTGSFHLLVVSGLHLAIVAGLVFALARWFRLGRLWASLATVLIASCYAVLTGLGQPVLRSLLMVSLYLLSQLIFREKNPLNAIGFAALCLVALQPHAVLEAGLQMTLLSVITIAGIAAPLIECWITPWLRGTRMLQEVEIDPGLPIRVAQFRVGLRMYASRLRYIGGDWLAWRAMPAFLRLILRVAELFIVSAVMELAMTLPMAVYFHRITIAALPVNILLVPFISLLLPLALLTFAIAFLWPGAVTLPAALTAAVLHTANGLVHWMGSSTATDLRVAEPGAAILFASILVLALALICIRLSWWGRLLGLAAMIVAAGIVILPRPVQHQRSALEIEVIDVGQGDALLVITPDGKTMLIDAGGVFKPEGDSGEENASGNFDIGEDVVSPALWSRGIRRLDVAVLSHAHTDHMGGLYAVLRNFHPRELWVGKNPDIAGYRALLAEAAQLGITMKPHFAGEKFSFGVTTISVLAPEHDYVPGPKASNNDSLVLQVRYRDTAAFLEGDAESPVEEMMVNHGGLKSILLKVGHHGSISSTSPEFLSAVAPAVGVISVGAKNRYDHPRIETLERLQRAHVQLYRTDMHGTSCFFLDGTKVTSHPMCR